MEITTTGGGTLSIQKVNQGKVVVESQEHGGFLMLLPDGAIEFKPNCKAVERAVKEWAAADMKEREAAAGPGVGLIGVMTVEWR